MSATKPGAEGESSGAERVRKLLEEARSRGVRLWVKEGELCFRALPGNLTDELRARIQQAREDLIACLGGPSYRRRAPARVVRVEEPKRHQWRSALRGVAAVRFTNGTHAVVSFRGAFCVDQFQHSVDALVARHPILGARVNEGEHGPEFLLEENPRVRLQYVDLSGTSADTRTRRAEAGVFDLVWQPFDLERGPLFRPFVVKVEEREYLLGFAVHHFICDFWSLRLITAELIGGYWQLVAGKPLIAREKPLQYSDYAAAMNEWWRSPAPELRLAYWRRQLHQAPVTRLPVKSAAISDQAAPLIAVPISVGAEICSRLVGFSRTRRATLFAAALAANAVALAHVGRLPDIAVLVIHARRETPLLQELIASPADLLVVRLGIQTSMTFDEVLRQVTDTLEAARSQEVPYEYLAAHLGSFGTAGVFPLFNLVDCTADEKTPEAAVEAVLTPFTVPMPETTNTAQQMPTHAMTMLANRHGISGELTYSPLVYEPATVERFLSAWYRVLEWCSSGRAGRLLELTDEPQPAALQMSHS